MVPQEVLAFLDWWDDELFVWHLDELDDEAEAESGNKTKHHIKYFDMDSTAYYLNQCSIFQLK